MCLSSKKTSTTSGKLSPTTQGRIDSTYNAGLGVANRPYEPYTGEIVAPFNPAQNQAFSMFGDIATNNPGGQSLASATQAAQGATSFAPTMVQGGYSPTAINGPGQARRPIPTSGPRASARSLARPA